MLFFENIDISFRPELDKIGIMFKKGNTGGSNFRIEFAQFFCPYAVELNHLTAVFFETGAMPTPTKSRNLTNCG